MDWKTVSVELILGGFFAIACIRSCIPAVVNGTVNFGDFLRFPGRIERLRRSRWQWFSMVALLLVIRAQKGVPFVLEAIVAFQFLLFLALPTNAQARQEVKVR